MRFQIEKAAITDSDGVDHEYEIIVDRASVQRIDTPFGRVLERRGFIRCHGKQYLGAFGREQPIYAGSEDDTYYAPMFEFDGTWSHSGRSERGNYSHVTADSGTGKLFGELEAFCESQGVVAQY